MFERLEWFLIGTSGLFEIVLLLLLCQPINRSHVAVWLKCLLSGAILYHLGYFGRLILAEERFGTARWIDQFAMMLLCSGLLWMPCSMLHAAWRLQSLGSQPLKPLPQRDVRYSVFYLPMLVLIPAGWQVFNDRSGEFLQATASIQGPYIGFVTFANTVSAFMFFRQALLSERAIRRQFFLAIGCTLVFISVGALLYTQVAVDSGWERIGRVLLGIVPVVPSLLFLWFTLRNRLLPVVFDQSIVYGGALLVLLFLHRLLVTPITLEWRKVLDIDFIVIEVAVVSLLIWLYRPWRFRVSEALRFLFSPQVFHIRDQTRLLSLAIAQQNAIDESQRCEWFARELQARFRLTWVRLVLWDHDQKVRSFESCSDTAKNSSPFESVSNDLASSCLLRLLETMEATRRPIERGEREVDHTDSDELLDAMETLECDVAFPLIYKSVRGVLLFGSREIFDRLAEEQLLSLSVLMEQFAVTLQNFRDEQARRRAERDSIQKEKLSTLGMISGALAHELRNPLSSIRTIACLVEEELPDTGSHREDLKLIVNEVDRLTQTLHRVLEFARPSDATNKRTEPDRVASRVLAIMDYYAKQNNVAMEVQLNAPGVCIEGDDLSLHEVFMNLIKNGVEASLPASSARVTVRSSVQNGDYTIEIIDRGVGIEPERLPTVFLPFETNKSNGTGLGLYVVSDRVKELNGRIDLESQVGIGTTFRLRFPCSESDESEPFAK